MELVCDLLANGAQSDKYKRKIPAFYRDNFFIDGTSLARLKNLDALRGLAKRSLEVKYNSGISARVLKKIEETVKLTCDLEGLTYSKGKTVDFLQREMSFAVPNGQDPKIIIDVSYAITTSSTQTSYNNKVALTKKLIAEKGKEIVTVNVLDGAGWLGRQSDLNEIYRNSDYTLNLANIGLLGTIIKNTFEG